MCSFLGGIVGLLSNNSVFVSNTVSIIVVVSTSDLVDSVCVRLVLVTRFLLFLGGCFYHLCSLCYPVKLHRVITPRGMCIYLVTLYWPQSRLRFFLWFYLSLLFELIDYWIISVLEFLFSGNNNNNNIYL